jgi:hypothetical protein
MRVGFHLLNDSGPPPTYIFVDGQRYMLVSHAADQMLAAIESAERAMANKSKFDEPALASC